MARSNKTVLTKNLEQNLVGQGFTLIAGVDEAGRGALAGPVFAAAVILPDDAYLPCVNDSKKLTPQAREKAAAEIKAQALTYAVSFATNEEIDSLNILRATFLAMKRAINMLDPQPDIVLVDGLEIPDFSLKEVGLVKGDEKFLSIAAASILAKTLRDEHMKKLALDYPGYGFEKHKGYGTKAHVEILKKLGPSPCHRLTFEPVKSI